MLSVIVSNTWNCILSSYICTLCLMLNASTAHFQFGINEERATVSSCLFAGWADWYGFGRIRSIVADTKCNCRPSYPDHTEPVTVLRPIFRLNRVRLQLGFSAIPVQSRCGRCSHAFQSQCGILKCSAIAIVWT